MRNVAARSTPGAQCSRLYLACKYYVIYYAAKFGSCDCKVDREVDAGRIVSVSMSTSTWPVGRAGPMLVSPD